MYRIVDESMVLRVEDNMYIVVPSETVEYAQYLAWLDAGNAPLPAPDPEPTPPVYPSFTALEMLALFTPEERRTITAAAMSDVDIKIWYDDLVAATYVTYEDPRTEGGLQALVDGELITPERKEEIVQQMLPEELRTPVEDTPPQEPEVPDDPEPEPEPEDPEVPEQPE